MTREILFKAKRKNWRELPKEEWRVEGYPVKYQPCAGKNEYVYGIVPTYASALYIIEIDPKTLCQYTGLHDRTKWEQLTVEEQKVFLSKWNYKENRKNKKEDWNGKRIWENDVLTEKHRGRIHYVFKVVWDMEEGSWMCESKYGSLYGIGIVNQSKFEKEGNIFDNPELLGDAE